MKNLKIKYKIAFSSILLIFILGFIISLSHLMKDFKTGKENYLIIGESIIRSMEYQVSENLLLKDFVELKRMINTVKFNNPDVEYIFIIDNNNEVLVSTFNDGFPVELLDINMYPKENVELLDTGKKTIFDFSYPVENGKLGIIRVGISNDRLILKLKSEIISAIIILLLVIVLGVFMSFYISKLITHSLKKLIYSVEHISKGEFDKKVEINSTDEIGQLSISFDLMRQNLKRLTDTLEEKILLLDKKNNDYLKINNELKIADNELRFSNEELLKTTKELQKKNSELKKSKKLVERSDNLKTEFLHNLSHEIRTPMNAIIGFSSLLDEDKISLKDQKKFIKIIQNKGDYLLKIINDIMEISTLETKNVKIKEQIFPIDKLFTLAESLFKIKAEKKNIPLNFKNLLTESESFFYTDKEMLYRIINVLLENAIKYTESGYIEMGCSILNNPQIADKKIQFYVKDTGIGILNKNLKIIFEKFSQEEKELTKNVGGLGLGLSIAQKYVTLLQGEIKVVSIKGKGTTFFVELPYRQVLK